MAVGSARACDVLRVWRSATTFEFAPHSRVVHLGKRPVLVRIVDALLDAHRRQPGTGLSTADLVAVAWPEERILPKAARNRLHVAISTLRTLGFDSVLVRTRDGYAIAAGVKVVGE